MDNKTQAILAYVFGWIGGLVVLLGINDNSRSTRIHAAQSIILSAAYFILLIFSVVTGLVCFFGPLLGTVYIAAIIFGIIKAVNEDAPELPLIGELAKSIFGKMLGEEDGEPGQQ
ncbi:MAG: hypothetical protein FWC79_00955 [Oscillospiraceae bacterium]|nr:hypothetical protein [Oscillospiraceae bacterium]